MIAPLASLVLAAGRIKHVVVLYEENRAFDHFFGHQKALKVDGLKGNETNPIDYKHPSKGSVKVFDGAPYVAKEQPRHGYSAYQTKFDIVDGYPRMDGFVTYERSVHPLSHKTADAVMQGFTDGALPISTTLASEFAVFDKWYAAFPGPSWPNHMMSMSATSNGGTNTGDGYQCTKGAKYPQRTIFDNLLAAGHEYARIYNDSVVELYLESFNSDAAKQRTQTMDRFFSDAAKGTLPALTWISPRQGVNKSLGDLGGPNSDHPNCCDVALGERLRKDIYEAVRAGPAWNETAILFTWDDPGGFFDHVSPPMKAPAPDDQHACFCFEEGKCKGTDPRGYDPYTRLGSRLPVILISPWVKKGTVVSEPPSISKPFNDSQYDGTSIVSTIKRLFNLPRFLTKRDAWSASFAHVFEELTSPRGDTPYHLPEAPKPTHRTGKHPYGTDCDDPSRRMRRSIKSFEDELGVRAPERLHSCASEPGDGLFTQSGSCGVGSMLEASEWLANATSAWRERKERAA